MLKFNGLERWRRRVVAAAVDGLGREGSVVGFGRRLVRKAVRKATPRTVRRAMHPVRTVKNAVTPRPVKQLSRAVYTITNPLGAAENKLIGALLDGGHRGSTGSRSGPVRQPAPRQVSSGTVAAGRAAEAVGSHNRIAQLMAVQRERFAESRRPIIAAPAMIDPAPLREAEWDRRKHEVRFWQRAKRAQLQLEVNQYAQSRAVQTFADLQVVQRQHQAAADAWWNALCQGEPGVLTAALTAAFADNPAPVAIREAQGTHAVLVLVLPGPEVLPTKKPHITPTGRLSSKAWTKTEFNEVYRDLLGAHLLATIRETWAVGRSLTTLRIIGMRWEANQTPRPLFDVDVERNNGQWHHDDCGTTTLKHAQWGLNQVGRTLEIQPWHPDHLRPDAISHLRDALQPGMPR